MESAQAKVSENRAKKLSIGGAVLGALAASSCCIGPVLVSALGVGGAGAFATISGYRPYILVGTVALLGVGYYLTHRKRKARADACGCEKPSRPATRAGKIAFWMATAMVIFLVAIPPVLAQMASDHAAVPMAAGLAVETTSMRVQGIDCEGCATGLRKAMTRVGGFYALKLDISHQTVLVTYERAPGRLQAYAKAIEDETGYEVTLAPHDTAAVEP